MHLALYRAFRLFCVLALASLAACALPRHPDLPVSSATEEWADTPVGKMALAAVPDDGRSGFRVLPVACFSFETRTTLARLAVRTLDVQYYIFANDDTGRALLKALGAAARRGVRVRLLVDDLYSTGEDKLLSEFGALPNVEVRLFNPFAGGRDSTATRITGAVLDLARIDRRMHNKLFIADNAAALAGGRNIANEYFMHSATSNFVDVDLFTVGPAVRQLSTAFDRYWNSAEVFPLSSVSNSIERKENAIAQFDAAVERAQGPPTDDLAPEFRIYGTLPDELISGKLRTLTLGAAEVVADDPDKARIIGHGITPTVTNAVLARLAKATDHVEIVSPYFVPGELGMKMMHEANLRNGITQVYTNSLASTDEPIAEHGYMQYRKAMLEDHVELYELSPSLARERNRLGEFRASSGSLHAKVVVIDGKTVFLGSMNLDHRSAEENTEVGILVESPALASELVGLLDTGSFYRLSLDRHGEIEWTAGQGDATYVSHEDPETSWWQRLKPTLLGPFVPEDQL
jgi:putative cardiolipin synthase